MSGQPKNHARALASAALLLCLFLALSQLKADGQINNQTNPQARQCWRQNSAGMNQALARHANIQQLTDTPELPQLPGYSGKLKFLRGCIQPTGKGWTVYQISYLTKEEPLKVKDWYENALGMYEWKILSSAGQTLTANHKQGHVVTLIFNPTTQPGFRTRMGLFFSQAPQLNAIQEE